MVAAVLGVGHSASAQSVLRTGDTVEIRLAGVPSEEMSQFSAPYTVDSKGMLNIPYIGLMKAVGLQASQIQRNIEEKLKADKIYTHPTVTVSTQNFSRFVNIGGPGVRSPQRVPYTADLTVMSAISAAGGFSDFADRKRVRLIRDGKATTMDIRKFLEQPTLDPAVQPGDQIEVPASMF